jgi:hypothetical protein
MLVTFVVYFAGRKILGALFHVPLFWGGSVRSERLALVLVLGFAAAVSLGYAISPRVRSVGLQTFERGPVARFWAKFFIVGYLIVGGLALLLLIQRLGGLAQVLAVQAAWASQIKERGLGPLYSLTYLFVIGCLVGAFRALLRRERFLTALWVLGSVIPAVILGRRVIILFTALPLLAQVHYHQRRLHFSRLVWVGALAALMFFGILLLRLRVRGTIAEAVASSNEFAVYDAMVAAVDRHRDLADFNFGYFLRHPSDFWGSNAGALYMQRMVGFQFAGGATPPSAVGVLWVYFGLGGVLISGALLGFVLGRIRREAFADPVSALLYGFVLFYWFDFLRNGDIVLGLKLFARYGAALLLLLLMFYRIRLVSLVPMKDRHGVTEKSAGD